jgi:hypothetical protein
VFEWNRYKPRKPFKPRRPRKKWNALPILLIIVGSLLVMIYTPPWVWFFLLGLVLIATGILSLCKWR